MTTAIAGVLTLSATAFGVLLFALNSHRATGRRCDAGCGATIEPYTGTRDESGHHYCSTTCADVSARARTL